MDPTMLPYSDVFPEQARMWAERGKRKLTKQEEHCYVRQRRYAELIAAVEPYIRTLLEKREFNRHEFLDCYQYVWVYLLKCCNRFDPQLGAFTTWVTYRARRAIQDWVTAQRLIRVPKYHAEQTASKAASRTRYAKYAEIQIEPSDKHLWFVSDRPLNPREPTLDRWRSRVLLYLDPDNPVLNANEKAVLEGRLRGSTLKAIGQQLRLTKARILQLQALVIHKIQARELKREFDTSIATG